MASLLSLSSAPPSTATAPSLLSSNFKGNITFLKRTPYNINPLKKLHLRTIVRVRTPLTVVCQAASKDVAPTTTEPASAFRFRLDNLGPQPGSRKKAKRKGRGIAAGQGNSCGFGMKGQKARSGAAIRKGFEGGQTPLYRRIPKLRGIAGGMRAGLPKYVPVNLRDIESAGFEDGEEVSLESLKERGIINPSGRERTLPLKVLGEGEISAKLHIKARAFSESAKEKLEAAGCSLTVLPGRKKWLPRHVAKNLARADAYFAKKRAAAAAASAATESA